MRGQRKPIAEEYFGGFDLSLTSSGVVIIDSKGVVVERHILKTSTKGPQRLDEIQQRIRTITSPYNIAGVCIEGYSMGSKFGREKAGELGGVIRLLLYRKGIKFNVVAPTSLKKFTTGSGGGDTGSKDQMTMYVFKNWGFTAKNNDEADACALAHVARGICGYGELKKHQKEVIQTVLNPPVKNKKSKKKGEEDEE